MKVLQQKEIADYQYVEWNGGKTMHNDTRKLVDALQTLQVGQGVFLERNEWHLKSEPSGIVSSYFKGKRAAFQQRSLADKSGWVFTRIR